MQKLKKSLMFILRSKTYSAGDAWRGKPKILFVVINKNILGVDQAAGPEEVLGFRLSRIVRVNHVVFEINELEYQR